jgi:hypothetical protein
MCTALMTGASWPERVTSAGEIGRAAVAPAMILFREMFNAHATCFPFIY